jgi:hypothetical protein
VFFRVGGLQDSNRNAVLGDGYPFTLENALKQLGEMGFGFIGADGFHGWLLRLVSD